MPLPHVPDWLPPFLVGVGATISHTLAYLARSPLSPRFPLIGVNPMDFNQARAAGLQVGTEVGKVVGAALGFVEGLMPGASSEQRHAALADFVSKQLAAVEAKADAALGIPAEVAAEVAALTTNPAAIAWVIGWFEGQAAAPAPQAEAPPADQPAA